MAIDSRLHSRKPLAVVILTLLHMPLVARLILHRHGAPPPIHTLYSRVLVTRSLFTRGRKIGGEEIETSVLGNIHERGTCEYFVSYEGN